MKALKHPIMTDFSLVILTSFLILSTLNCKKKVAENPFVNITTLDCRNLLIRSISLKDSTVELAMQNTCNNCTIPDAAYIAFLIIDRQTADTLNTVCYCFNPPLNGQTLKYLVKTKLNQLPDPKTLEFDFGNLCKDLSYLPN